MSQVFVVDRSAFFDGAWPQGFQAMTATAGAGLLNRAFELGRFVDREEAERNPAWKQWIPYCVLRSWPAGDSGLGGSLDGVFCVRRTRGQSEARLHGLWSIGLGGHVEPVDRIDLPPSPGTGAGEAFFGAALDRELREELLVAQGVRGTRRFLGLLNDDASAVGQVHAGLVYAWDLPGPWQATAKDVGVGEISKMEGGFTSLVEFRKLWQDPLQFETWSRFLVRAEVAGPMGALRQVEDQAPTGTTGALRAPHADRIVGESAGNQCTDTPNGG